MTLSQAQLEFKIRYYLWAGSEWEREISESFTNIRKFKSGTFWQTYQFMRRLSPGDQLTTARALLERFHPDAVKALGETCSPEEESLRFRRDEFFRIKDGYQMVRNLEKAGQQAEARALFELIRPQILNLAGEQYFNDANSLRSRLDDLFDSANLEPSFEENLLMRKKAGEKFKFAGKRKLQNAITDKFKKTFETRVLKHEFDDISDPSSQFDLRSGGWILSTHFWFGRSAALINYNQSISSEEFFEHQGPNGAYQAPLGLASMISFSSWLGITSQSKWEYITPEEVDLSCDEVMRHVLHFVEIAPKLLANIDVEKITRE